MKSTIDNKELYFLPLDPSPDWIVGVSGLELCLRNCSWVESLKFNLYPWDAGTDDGITYLFLILNSE
ncbi:hypothetical protein J437_LFUL008065 [Ladona fulva]|uniref:Spondin domain-containing protein n=1 Tax=Ladona fulva TaxID=123851 RepID=A0A8K0KC91_LADFU|nr:hypothetical protein J437_LFUL008065 [Ladona fulva]